MSHLSKGSGPLLVTDRMPYSVKRDGGKITDCEAEPIQAPGCIQGHGVLIAVRASDLTILQVSETCRDNPHLNRRCPRCVVPDLVAPFFMNTGAVSPG
jgi:hypothetical protein